MVMRKLCAGFVWTTIRARLGPLDENIGTFARFNAYITEKLHTKNVMYFLDRGSYVPYVTCVATPLL